VKATHVIDSRNRQSQKNIFRDDYKKEVENKTLLKQMVAGDKYANIWSDVNHANRNNCFIL